MRRASCICAFLVGLLIPVQAMALDNDPENGGFFGNLIIGGGPGRVRPGQHEVGDDNKLITSLDDRAERETEGVLYLIGEIGYRFSGSGTEISLQSESEGENLISLVVSQPLWSLGTLHARLGCGVDEVWQGPYITGVRRKETDQDTLSLEVGLEEILGSGAMLSLKGSEIDVDEDVIGTRHGDLQRDGRTLSISVGYAFQFGESSVLIPGFTFEVDDRDGKSSSSQSYRMELVHALNLGHWLFETSLAWEEREFDRNHPIFSRTREETGLEAVELITYQEPFGWQNFSLYGLVAYTRWDANIDFYDSDGLAAGLGIGYSF
jgi:hypothetical protein